MVLRHRDRELLRFEWVEPQGVRVVSVNEAERRFLPLEMHGVVNDETLWTWLTRRIVPRNRRNIEELMARIGLSSRNVKGITELCRGLSLNDVYWVVPDGFPNGLSKNMKERLDGLRGFRLKRHPRYNLPARRIEAIEDFTQKRIREICEYGVKADEFLSIQEGECTVNRAAGSVQCTHTSDSLSEQIKQSMRADPFITKMELADFLQISPRWVARKMKDLQASGEIRRVGADKNGHWEVVDSDEGQ